MSKPTATHTYTGPALANLTAGSVSVEHGSALTLLDIFRGGRDLALVCSPENPGLHFYVAAADLEPLAPEVEESAEEASEEASEAPAAATVRLKVPRTFYEDHRGRDYAGGADERWLHNQVEVTLDAAGYEELRRDAQFYVENRAHIDEDLRYLADSARRTLRALERAGRP